ncbi:MAG TPA: NrfD/PsrC family molybdoenzyme membrane anchor subunit [Burkholderiales bacterium]|nr:NrfD/PsrC family molybdoenzyme membrane anchor subunit [Burkholderiales bacterium]
MEMAIPSSTWFTAAPHWQWLIVLWFFFGGLAAGCYFFATLIDLFGRPEDRPIARAGYLAVLPCLVVSGIVLIVDLSRPERFWHLLLENHTFQPIFKYWSPMSIGSWVLLAMSFFAVLSFIGALSDTGRVRWAGARQLRPPARLGTAVALIGALLGLWLAGYTGVLLAVTNRPIWADTPLLGLLLLLSAASIAAAFLILLAHRYRWHSPGAAALERIEVWILALELLALIAVVVSLGPAARPWLGAWGVLLIAGPVALGMLLPLALHRRRDWLGARTPAAAALLVLVGGFLLRVVVVMSSEGVHL